MAEAVVVVIGFDEIGDGVADVIDAHASLSQSPTEFQSLLCAVVAASVFLLCACTLNVPVGLDNVFCSLFIVDLKVTDFHVVHPVEGDEALCAFLTHLHMAPFLDVGTSVVTEHYLHLQLLEGMLCEEERGDKEEEED